MLAFAFPDLAKAEINLIEDASPLRVSIGAKTVRLEALVVKPANGERLPVALIAHGKPRTQGQVRDEHARNYLPYARDLARRGWLTVVVMRRGFGNSDGPESARPTCGSKSLIDRIDADAEDLQATIAAIGQRPDADVSRIIAIGVSAGGAAAIALSARNPAGLLGVINVSGGLLSSSCPKEELPVAIREYGVRSRVPSLWLYAKNDPFFGPDLVERMRAGFLEAGGDSKLVMFDLEGADGHQLFGSAAGRMKWLPEMDAFLRYHKLPTWSHSDVDKLMQKLGAGEEYRGFIERHIAAPGEKALAREKDGKHLSHGYGWHTVADARKTALDFCRKTKPACEVLMENDVWVESASR